MADETAPDKTIQIATAVLRLLLLTFLLPFAAATALGYSLPALIALVTGTLVIEYGATPIGLGLNMHPLYVLFATSCIALGITLFLFDIIAILKDRSHRVKKFLAWSEEKGKKSRYIARYGIWGLVPCVMVLGFYVCPPVACVFGWNRDRATILIMAGFVIIAAATILLALGIIHIFSGQGP